MALTLYHVYKPVRPRRPRRPSQLKNETYVFMPITPTLLFKPDIVIVQVDLARVTSASASSAISSSSAVSTAPPTAPPVASAAALPAASAAALPAASAAARAAASDAPTAVSAFDWESFLWGVGCTIVCTLSVVLGSKLSGGGSSAEAVPPEADMVHLIVNAEASPTWDDLDSIATKVGVVAEIDASFRVPATSHFLSELESGAPCLPLNTPTDVVDVDALVRNLLAFDAEDAPDAADPALEAAPVPAVGEVDNALPAADVPAVGAPEVPGGPLADAHPARLARAPPILARSRKSGIPRRSTTPFTSVSTSPAKPKSPVKAFFVPYLTGGTR